MSVRALLLAGLPCLLMICGTGCHRRNPKLDLYVDAMAAEYRALEDRYYDLQFDYERKVAEVEKLRRRVKDGRGADTNESPPLAPQRSIPPEEEGIPDLSPPVIDPGTPVVPGLEPPDAPQRPDDERDARDEPALDEETGGGEPAARRAANQLDRELDAEDSQVAKIALHPGLTGGQDFDDAPGDDGLTVVIEPLSESGRIVSRPGKVTVVALDPSQQGEAARVAKWTVERERVARSLGTPSERPGIHLKLAWPRRKPQHRRLQIFVRYETEDGRRLEANQEIEIALPGELAGRWTPRKSPAASDPRRTGEARVARRPGAPGRESALPKSRSPSPPPEPPGRSPYR